MMYALRATDGHLRDKPFETWVHLRVEAGPNCADPAIEKFVDPMCGGEVVARFVNNIWQWMHVRRRCNGETVRRHESS